MKFKRASEPTDIIWENRHFTEEDYFYRRLKAYTLIGVLLLASFAVMYSTAHTAAEIGKTFPPRDCDSVKATYGGQLQDFALQDFDFVEDYPGVPTSGALQCFCKDELEQDYDKAVASTYGHPQGRLICSEYSSIVSWTFLKLNLLKYFIIIVNFVLRTICIALVAWIGYSTETVKLRETTKVTFIVQFFNTAILLLLVNADLSLGSVHILRGP